jgi:hypothetical protein
MFEKLRPALAFGLLTSFALACGLWIPQAVNSQDPVDSKKGKKDPAVKSESERDQSEFMRKKLTASNQILEGLVTEDVDLVKKGAKSLVELSSAEKWQVHHNAMYKQQSNDFQRTAKKLVEAAESENFDSVALKWIDTTMKCVECHKYVRTISLATQK